MKTRVGLSIHKIVIAVWKIATELLFLLKYKTQYLFYLTLNLIVV